MRVVKENVKVYSDSYDYGVVDLFVATYHDGSTALAVSEEYGPEVVSVNLGDYGMSPGDNCVFVKNYSPHVGLADSLVEAGVAEIVRPVKFGFGTGFEIRLLFPLGE